MAELKKYGFLFCLFFLVNVQASLPVGTYLSVKEKPIESQVHLLSQTIQIRFPISIQTVGEAVNYVLRFSGYSLVSSDKQSMELKNTLKKPLPLVQRSLE